MVVAGDFRKGVTLEMEGKIYVIVDFQHVKPGKGAAFVRAKLKNIVTGQVLEQTFNPSDKFQNAHIDRKELQYSYNDDGLYFFMDMDSFEMVPLDFDVVEDSLKFMKEEMVVTVQFFKGVPFSVDAPNFVELMVVDTEPGVQGDTSKAGNKPAKLETGYNINVPLFVNNGEKIRVDTRTGTYMERVK